MENLSFKEIVILLAILAVLISVRDQIAVGSLMLVFIGVPLAAIGYLLFWWLGRGK